MSFVSTLGAVSTRKSVARFPRLKLAGLEDMGAAAAVRSIARNRNAAVRLPGLGDMGRAIHARALPRTIRFTMRGLGETSCTIDPVTGGRVCTSGPATASTPSSSCTSITPRYLPDPTQQRWAWDNPMPANWIFTGRDNVNSIYDMYMRQDGQAFAAVGPGGGFMYNDPRRATVPAYGPCVAPTPAPVPTPVTPNPVVDASSGQPATIQPVTTQSIIPSPMVATGSPAMFPTSSSVPWKTYALYGGIGLGALLILKWVGVIKK